MSTIDDVKDRIDIVEFISKYVRLQKSGKNYKGLCPFHTEKTPSFYVFPDTDGWHCFGCGKGGDVFTFLMDHDGYDFKGALTELARQAGVELQPMSPQQVQRQSENERLLALMEEATEFYHALLMKAPQAGHARAYLRGRGFTRETVVDFRVGYAPKEWDAARTHLLGKGFSVEEQIKAGMLVERDQGGTFDRFRDRVMIPICDRRGRVIAFGGRVLRKEDNPKYMNSPQTPLFDKSAVLFGFDKATNAIRDKEEAIIVEGYMDVMIPHQAGYKNVVAPMGTALTEQHLKQLQRLTKRFVLALDPDAAGVHGTIAGAEAARETLDKKLDAVFDRHGIVGIQGKIDAEIRVITMPDGLDPDEIILDNPERWEALLATSQPVVRFIFEQLMHEGDYTEPKRKAQIIEEMLPYLLEIRDRTEREAYIREISLRLNLHEAVIKDRVIARERTNVARQKASQKVEEQNDELVDPQRHALSIIIKYPGIEQKANVSLVDEGFEPISGRDFSGNMRIIWETWLKIQAAPETTWQDYLAEEQLEEVGRLERIILPEAQYDKLVRDVSRAVMQFREKRLVALIDQMYGLLQTETDAQILQQHILSLQKVTEQLKRLHQSLTFQTSLRKEN